MVGTEPKDGEEEFGHLGKSVDIDDRAMMIEKGKIFLSDNVSVGMYASVNAAHKMESVDLEKEGIFIGRGTKIHPFGIIESVGGYIDIGEDCSIKEYCLLYGTGGIEIGNFVRIAPRVSIIAENHNMRDPNIPIYRQEISYKGIKIGDDIWIGANCVILDGIQIGSYSVIGAGSVVTCNIPSYSIAMGNPAIVKRRRM